MCLSGPAVAQTYSGAAQVVDGDTIRLTNAKHPFRLHGIDAPERAQLCDGQLCGQAARDWLKRRIEGQLVTCAQTDWDSRFNRSVAVCYLDGEDINRMLVQSGYARAYLKYSSDYALDEKEAALNQRGLWAGEFGIPSEFRAAKAAVTSAAQDCIVKGNISPNSGEKIYHVVGQQHYAKVSINVKKGEACFATEDEARAAGWRKAFR